MQEVIQLTCAELIVERPFTDPDHVAADSAVLQTMLNQAWQIADQMNEVPRNESPLIVHFPNLQTWQKRMMILDLVSMYTATSFTLVGFFGNKRLSIAPEIEARVFAAGKEFCSLLHTYPDIVCYATNLLADAYNYANLVMMKSVQTIEEWRSNELHQWVAETLSPEYYTNIRIYSGSLSIKHQQRLFSLRLQRVKYFDYSARGEWRAVRWLDQSTSHSHII